MEAGQIFDDNLNSMIGIGTRFKGEFELDGLLRIDGDFSGVIRTTGKVVVGRSGRVECTMYVGRVVIGGIVRGDIYSKEMVTILSSGIVIGNISTPRLVVEEGVLFNGTCKITKAEVPGEKIPRIGEREISSSTNSFASAYQKNEVPSLREPEVIAAGK